MVCYVNVGTRQQQLLSPVMMSLTVLLQLPFITRKGQANCGIMNERHFVNL